MPASLLVVGDDASRLPDRAMRERHADWPVALVSMPFMGIYRPSIQLGLLKATAERYGFPTRTLHANLDFAARIGTDYYSLLSEHRGRMVGEWIFSVAAFGDAAPDPVGRLPEEFADDLAYLGGSPKQVRDRLLRTRDQDVPAYLDALVESFPWGQMRVVGFSSTYQQNTASIALARRLKQRWPELITVFGGANLDGEMGPALMRSVRDIDFAVTGEGDLAFPRLLCAFAAGTDPGAVPGVVHRREGVVRAAPSAPSRRLDDLPVPDYGEFFQRAEDLGVLPRVGHRKVWIPFETSRGCWWGAKHHCTFCGLNGATMQFRVKSPDRVLDELGQQARRYGSFLFEAVDNILEPTYLKRLFPAIVASGAGYEFFYEVKANLTREQLRLLAMAGVTRIQPGVESLSSSVLELMRKGVTAAQNVNLLRWARYYGIDVSWSILYGFPGETVADYVGQADVLPQLRHLQPPIGANRIWLERFSPLYTDAESFGLRRRSPERSYHYVYPTSVDLDRVAYFFEYELSDALPEGSYDDLDREVRAWSDAWSGGERPSLSYWSAPGYLQIYDGRQPGHEGTYNFHDTLADIYLSCIDRPTSAAAVRRKLNLTLADEAIQEVFEEFRRRGLMFLDGARAVALALPAVAGR